MDLFKTYSEALSKLNATCLRMHIPMVFKEDDTNFQLPAEINTILEKCQNRFTIMQHSRQYWYQPIDTAHPEDMKYNDRLIRGIKMLVDSGVKNISCLFSEYGPDVSRSKSLINELGLTDYFIWLPQLPRKYLLKIISEFATICADQFGGGYFGGTGYEALACGKPLMVSVSISSNDYTNLTGIDFPPIINVSTPAQIADKLRYYISNPDELKNIERESALWFHKNCGYGLIDKYISLFEKINLMKKP